MTFSPTFCFRQVTVLQHYRVQINYAQSLNKKKYLIIFKNVYFSRFMIIVIYFQQMIFLFKKNNYNKFRDNIHSVFNLKNTLFIINF